MVYKQTPVYKWKGEGVYDVDAQTAGEELERIYSKNGTLTAADVVEESRSELAPLHSCFEWRDGVAAEEYRKEQARRLMRAIVQPVETPREDPTEVRAFFNVQHSYHPFQVIVQSEDKMEALLKAALRELRQFQNKYNVLSQLSPVFDAIDALEEGV